MPKSLRLPEPDNNPNDSAVDPFDSRYYDRQVATYLSAKSQIAYQAYVEAALAQTLADFEICSREIASEIEQASQKVQPEAVREEEQTTQHNIKALVNVIKQDLSEQAKPYVHFGATSYDIVANAMTLQLRDTMNEVVLSRLQELITTLAKLTETYADTPQIGRTHGQHAVPITFGFALSEYVSRLGETTVALEALTKELKGKFSGAVGAYNGLSIFVDDPLEFEAKILTRLELEPAEFSTQIAPPEGMIRLFDELAIAAGIMANLAHDMRHLQRTEIGEIRERFEEGQTGSSTMAHKRNPWNFENVVSMSKQVLAQALNANLNISSEHQRDLTDSASSRFYGLALAGVANMTQRLNKVMGRIEVDEEAMQRNLNLTGGAIAAEPLYLLLEKYGHTSAHEKAKALAHQALASNQKLAEAVQADSEISEYWQKFTDKEKGIISAPEKNYTGIAAKKAKEIVQHWKS
jgi:adenylosuccinate lyase